MALPPTKRTSQRFQTTDPDIESLQNRLLKSLSSAFDPTAATKSDDFFLAQDYSLGTFTENTSEPVKTDKNPYQALTEKAKSYVEKAKVTLPARAKTSSVLNKKSDTFLTYVDMDGNSKKKPPEPQEEEVPDPLPYMSYDNILGDVNSTGKLDDLEELRRMIRQTKKDMNEYERELIGLQRNILGVNDSAKGLGFGASQHLLHNIENVVNTLNSKNAYTQQPKKGSAGVKNMKAEGNSQGTNAKKPPRAETASMGTTGPVSFIVSKKSFGAGVRSSSFKGPVKK